MSLSRAVPLSVLDLSILREGATSADALAQTTALAQCAQESDYHRFWVAEQLHQLVARIGVNEAMVTAVAYDTEARVRSLQLLNKHW